ncbi:thioredoxin family protein [Persicobacter sp. CCB-QB2]|uniref:thioredoxin family protein n=1 Tax=Persicobacter sp. CCB-QB2 TaxID=1561025 RepID=UPI0006A98544|nr:thioredoxin family protein [Persicobacter sp. CCB-QB2]
MENSSPAVHQVSPEEFLSLNKKSTKSIVLFSAPWCGLCKRIAPIYRKKAMEIAQVNFFSIDLGEFPQARNLAEVTSLPFFATFIDGRIQERKASSKPDVLMNLINQLINE